MNMKLAAALILVCLSSSARADESGVPKAVDEMFPAGQESCYAALPSAKDRKPGQMLQEFRVYRLFDPHPAMERVEWPRDKAKELDRSVTDATSQWVSILARFTDSKDIYFQTASCSIWGEDQTAGVTCGVDCDGGYFSATKSADGFDLAFDRDSYGLRLSASCDGPDGLDAHERVMTPKDGGSRFSLKAMPVSTCQEADAELHSRFVKDPVSLRERIETKGWRCLKRVYDKAHLGSHPDQLVTAMAVAIKAPARAEDDGGYLTTRLDTTVSFRLRDGTEVSRDVPCYAEDYQFACEGNIWLKRRDDKSALLLAGPYDDLASSHPVLDAQLGADDVTFRLDASAEASCDLN